MLDALVEHVGRNRFPERDRVALEHALALRTSRRQGFKAYLFAAETRSAIDAADELPVAVDLRERVVARLAMEIVDVLRDEIAQDADLLEPRERVMTGVRLGDSERTPQFVVLAPNPVLPSLSRVGEENLVAVHRRLAVLGPESARPAKGWNPALD